MTPARPFGSRRGNPPKGARSTAWLLALFCLLMPARPAASDDVPLGPHADLTCGTCHVVDAADRLLEPVALKGRQETLCAGCHATAADQSSGANHPSGIVPARALPAEFPLDAEGRLTCVTCHALHGGAVTLVRGGAWACMACHSQ